MPTAPSRKLAYSALAALGALALGYGAFRYTRPPAPPPGPAARWGDPTLPDSERLAALVELAKSDPSAAGAAATPALASESRAERIAALNALAQAPDRADPAALVKIIVADPNGDEALLAAGILADRARSLDFEELDGFARLPAMARLAASLRFLERHPEAKADGIARVVALLRECESEDYEACTAMVSGLDARDPRLEEYFLGAWRQLTLSTAARARILDQVTLAPSRAVASLHEEALRSEAAELSLIAIGRADRFCGATTMTALRELADSGAPTIKAGAIAKLSEMKKLRLCIE